MVRRASGAAVPTAVRASPVAEPSGGDPHFWELWAAGTFGPLAIALVLVLSGTTGALVAWLAALGVVFLVVNGLFALVTDGYRAGASVQLGRAVARVMGWLVVATVGLVVVGAVLLAIAVLWALFSGRRE
jgi:hypothetical protein